MFVRKALSSSLWMLFGAVLLLAGIAVGRPNPAQAAAPEQTGGMVLKGQLRLNKEGGQPVYLYKVCDTDSRRVIYAYGNGDIEVTDADCE